MRSNSQAATKPTQYPSVSNKPGLYNRPTTRNRSIPAQFQQTTSKFQQTQVRPKRCPNCGLSFGPSTYNNHFRSCTRYNPERVFEPKGLNKQKFRIKKVPGRKEEVTIISRPTIKVEGKVMKNQKEKEVREEVAREEREVEKTEREKEEVEFREFGGIRKEESAESVRDEKGNSIQNVEEIEEIRHIIEEEENIVSSNSPIKPSVNNPPAENARNRLESSSSQSRESLPSPQPPARHQPPSHQRPPTPRPSLLPRRSPPVHNISEFIDQISITSISTLIQRLQFLHQNQAVLHRHRNLLNYINMINLMLQTGGIPQGSFQTIKNSLQYLVGELTHILSIIVSARMGMIVLLFRNLQDQPEESKGFSQQQIDTLFPPQIHNSKNETCTICLGDFVKYQRTIELKCKHEFHVGCISEWLLKRDNCPVCRTSQK